MVRVTRAVLLAAVVVGWSTHAPTSAQETTVRVPAGPIALTQAQPPSEEFVPVSRLPETEQLPAAPLLIGAYIVVWLVILVYLLSLWRRMAAIEREIADVERRLAERRRS
jgi:CcmD family protein